MTEPATPAPSETEQEPLQPMGRVIPLVLAVALFMEQMDSTVIATSLPAIAADIGTEPVALKLALTSYLVALAIFIPVSGWLADRYGARNVFRIAIGVFMIGSVACAFSDSLAAFVVSRFLQGVGGAMMTPVGRLVLVRLTPRAQLVQAMSWLTIPALIGPIAGPPLGGFITTYFAWEWIFWINVPIGLIGIVLATKFLKRTGFRDHRKVDTKGFVLAGVCFSGLVFGLSVISLPALPPIFGVVGMIVGSICGWLYWRHAHEVSAPLLDPRLLGDPIFRAALLGGSVFRIGVGAMAFLAPLMLQISFGYSPFEAGMITFSGAIGAILVKFLIGWMLSHIGYRRLIIGAILLSGCSVALMGTFTETTPVFVMVGLIFAGGFVRSTFFTADGSLCYTSIRTEDVGQATAIIAVGQQITIAVGVAMGGLLLETSSNLSGRDLALGDFHFTFWVMGFVTMLAVFWFIRLAPDAGQELSGHHPKNARTKSADKLDIYSK